jgi:hypothetical protein
MHDTFVEEASNTDVLQRKLHGSLLWRRASCTHSTKWKRPSPRWRIERRSSYSTYWNQCNSLDIRPPRLLSSLSTTESNPALIQSGGGNRPFEARQPALCAWCQFRRENVPQDERCEHPPPHSVVVFCSSSPAQGPMAMTRTSRRLPAGSASRDWCDGGAGSPFEHDLRAAIRTAPACAGAAAFSDVAHSAHPTR